MSSALTSSPLFVVGSVRSGTTLLLIMLQEHPAIHIFGEFEESVSRLGESGWPDLKTYVDYLRTDRDFLTHGFEIDESLDYPDLVRSFYAQARARASEPIVGASIHSRFDRCPELWPDARYIHIVRDPRDVAPSCVRMGWYGNAYHAARRWVDAERCWDRLRARTRPEQRHELRYESLVRDPEPVLREVCRFIGVDYTRALLDYSGRSTYAAPDPSLAEQWRWKMKPQDVRCVEAQCGSLLTERGYARSGLPSAKLGPLERAYLYADHRIGRARASVRTLSLRHWALERIAKAVKVRPLQRKLQLKRNAIVASNLR